LAALEQLADSVVLTDTRGVIVYVNEAWTRLNGYTAREAIGSKPSLLRSGRTEPGVYDALWRTVAGGGTFRGIVHNRRKDGEVYEAMLTVAPVRDSSGAITHYVGSHRGVAGQRDAEASFQALVDASPDAVGVHCAGRFVYVNRALCRYLGYERPEQLVDMPVLDVVAPEHRALATARIQAMMAKGGSVPPAEEKFVRRDGTCVTAEVVAIPVVFDGKASIVAVARDVTERNQLAFKAMAMDRMIAIGTLAAGVGHEINNPLTYVISNLDYSLQELSRRIEGGDPCLVEVVEALSEARGGAHRVRDVVRDLRTFSRAEVDNRGPVELHRVAESSLNMAWNEIRHRARLVKELSPGVRVTANEGRLGQVVLNLLLNAAHAIAEGDVEHNQIRVRTCSDGARVGLSVQDTGVGIPAENLATIFHPFFTTKPVGQGTGLGLWICAGIVHGLGGEIVVESAVGRGSTFTVWLPPASEEVAAPRTSPSPVSQARRGRILVVDDDAPLAAAMKRTLGVENDVVGVTRGAEALALVLAGERFDLVFCDLMMPEMTGMELYQHFATSAPEMASRIIFITGGAFTPKAREFLERVPNQHVEKPFDARNLRALVRDLLR
jgi:PAS domain S-box-containing protein